MASLRNASGRPLAGSSWLAGHHRAKLAERRAFCRRLARLRPSRVVDIGCATGLWLDELDKALPRDCEFVGLDSDAVALAEATERAAAWQRPVAFEQVDVEMAAGELPQADLTLLFNMSPYLPNLEKLLAHLAVRRGRVAIRQYDGAGLRFGPMETEDRAIIETSLRAALLKSEQFRHYDLDRLYAAIERAPFRTRDTAFELFTRTSPFPPEFAEYYSGTLGWMLNYLSDAAAERLRSWVAARAMNPCPPTYWVELDFTAVVS